MPTPNPRLYNKKYRIKSTRLPTWDYSSESWYFITICTKNRKCVLGDIDEKGVMFSKAGLIVLSKWKQIPQKYKEVGIDYFVITPNHIHGIICVYDTPEKYVMPVETLHEASLQQNTNQPSCRSLLSNIIGKFKMESAKEINRELRTEGEPFWQERYWDHIIRNEQELQRIKQYILDNPKKWHLDRNNPKNLSPTPPTLANINPVV